MKNYVKPTYSKETIMADDIVLTSIIDEGEATVGNITGIKGTVTALFDKIFGFND
jgi:hypothetical protein